IPAGGSTADDTFSGHYLPKGKAGSCILEYVFYNESNPSEKASMIVHFTASPTAVPDISSRVKLSNAYPNPANSKVSFDFDLPIDIKNASLKLYNLLGQPVAEQTINQTKGKIEMSVSDLNEGVYFYSLHINNETIITKKLIVRH
ncbi:MAG: T9SS type A sorting domain-containing protein, partial [Ignavibacteria bacterium]|nr:T9SS type A sorting domain-containing protein [Ignavibacteria bacterium]